MLCTLYANRAIQDYFEPPLSEIMWSNNGYSAQPDNVFGGQRQTYTVILGFTCSCSNAPLGEFQEGDNQLAYGDWVNGTYPQYCNHCLPGYYP